MSGLVTWPRANLTLRVLVGGLFILIVTFLIIAGSAWWVASDQAYAHAEAQVDSVTRGFDLDFQEKADDLFAVGAWISSQNEFLAFMRAKDGVGLARFFEPLVKAGLAAIFTAADTNGEVLARVRVDQPVTRGDLIVSQVGVREALAGTPTTAVELDEFGRLRRRVLIPITDPDTHKILGLLSLGYFLDGNLLRQETLRSGTEAIIVYQGRFLVTTLTDAQGQPWVDRSVPMEVIQAARNGTPTDLLTLSTDRGDYLFKFSPLKSPTGTTAGMHGIGVSKSVVESEIASLFRTFAAAFVLSALLMALIGFVFSRTLTTPISKLLLGVQGMAHGDLSTPLVLQRNDELGDLAQHMDQLRIQLREAAQSAALEKSRYAAVVRSMGVAAVITDRNHQTVAVNQAAERLLRQPPDQLLGQPWHKFLTQPGEHSGNGARPETLSWTHTGSGPDLIEHGRFTLRGQPQVTLDVISSEVQVDGEPGGYVYILHDVSAQENLVKAKDEFLLNVAHELRGPLSSLRFSIESLAEEYASMSKRDLGMMLRTMQKAVVRFQGLVENLVEIGSIQAGQFRVRPASTHLETLIRTSIEQVKPLLQARDHSLDVQMLSPEPCRVVADPPRIVQVLVNLLTNAIKYSPEGQPIVLSVADQSEFVVVKVTDRGPGIPLEEQANLFKRFYRTKRAMEEGIGIGLGLALARGIVEAHGGQMDVTSQVGQGTTFWFTLPKG